MMYKFLFFSASVVITSSLSMATAAELVSIDEAALADVSGQSGIGIDGSVDLKIGNIAYQQRPTDSYLMINDLVAQYNYAGAALDITAEGALRFSLPDFIQFDELSFSVYNSSTAALDINNPTSLQTYTVYASTLGNAYDGFNLDITGATFDNGSNRYSADYVNTNNLTDNANTSVSISEGAEVTFLLESEDDGFFNEDYAQITVVNEDGEVIEQVGSDGQNDASLTLRLEPRIHNNFLVKATLTGTLKMGGAIEMFSVNNVAFKR